MERENYYNISFLFISVLSISASILLFNIILKAILYKTMKQDMCVTPTWGLNAGVSPHAQMTHVATHEILYNWFLFISVLSISVSILRFYILMTIWYNTMQQGMCVNPTRGFHAGVSPHADMTHVVILELLHNSFLFYIGIFYFSLDSTILHHTDGV